MTEKDIAGIRLAAPFYYVMSLIIGAALDRVRSVPVLPNYLSKPVGYTIIAASFLLLWRVEREFSACQTSSSCRLGDSALITTGPFKLSRNPAYVGMAIMLLGVALMTNNLWLILLIVPTCLAVQRFCISKEEAYLEGKFGAAFSGYKAEVRRWF